MIFVNSKETAQKLMTDLSDQLHKIGNSIDEDVQKNKSATVDNAQKDAFVTVDTEFIREENQIPLLCLVQIATESENYVIDPISVDLNFLKPFFASENLKKVFHCARQDVEILQSYGFEINNFYDTQLYEMILSTKENISYQSIVSHYVNKKLKKNFGMSDWSKRPLSKKQLAYASEDVTYLRKVYQKQVAKLKKLHRENWLDEEMSQLMEKNSLEDSLNEASYPLLYKLLSWREKKSKEKNIAPELLASDRLIKSICRKGLEYIRNLKNSRNLVDDREFLDYAETIAEDFSPEKIQTERNPAVDLLKTLLDIKSKQHSVAPMMIASVKDLLRFVSGDRSVKFLEGWRREIFGDSALNLLSGKIKLGIENSEVILYE
ncbi:MAG: hypothetical protein J5821_02720 [Alphaproteobacteria bacterium]|nr:hypothetical protein [Alphaproteobacteria bacterium]